MRERQHQTNTAHKLQFIKPETHNYAEFNRKQNDVGAAERIAKTMQKCEHSYQLRIH